MISKCKNCIFGAKDLNNNYNFNIITKKINNKIITLNYNNNDCGCRMSQWIDKEIKCLNNNFCNFKSEN